MPDRVIKRVNTIGAREKQGRDFLFLNCRREPFEWTDEVPEDDPEFQGLLEEPAAYPDLSAEFPGVPLQEDDENFQVVTDDDSQPDFAEMAAAALDNAGINAHDRIQAAQHPPNPGPAVVEADNNKIEHNNEIVYEITFDMPDDGLVGNNVIPNIDVEPDEIVANQPNLPLPDGSAPAGRYPTRLRRSVTRYTPQTFMQLGEIRAHRSVVGAMKFTTGKDDEQIHATTWTGTGREEDDTEHILDKDLMTESDDELKVWAYVMTQYNLKPGLRKFGAKGATAAVNELTQLHVMDTWTPLDPSKLSREEKMKALSSLMFLKEKRCGKVKGRACINGAPQRAYITKEEAASPTVSTESTFITASIAAHEHRKVRCYDIPSAFVNTDLDEYVTMVLKGDLAEMMVQIAPEIYRSYVTADKKGTPILYVRLH
jgi:hypothetical protein